MNGAEALIRSLSACDVDCCFANPGTSEMHLVQAMDGVSEMRAVLCLFEGVCTGAADGYGRMAGRPAATLLHLGAGLANGIANLHNARRACTPLINLVGDHATWHVHHDAPLTSDIETLSRCCSAWTRTAQNAEELAQDGAIAHLAAMTRNTGSQGQISTLIIPAECAWGPTDRVVSKLPPPQIRQVTDARISQAAEIADEGAMFVLDGDALQEESISLMEAICERTGARFCSSFFPARIELGGGRPKIARMPYFPEQVLDFLKGVRNLILVGAQLPVSFFAYNGMPSNLLPEHAEALRLSHRHEDSPEAIKALADLIGCTKPAPRTERPRPVLPDGDLSASIATQTIAALLPENAIVSVDSGAGNWAFDPLQNSGPCTWLSLTGGSIGQGCPVATGAAIACPERPTFALLGDGGAMYTIQALWTQARESLNVTNIIFNNRAYNILDVEYRRLGIDEVGPKAASMFSLTNPEINWTAMGESMGVPAARAQTTDELAAALRRSSQTEGPFLIDCRLGG